MAGAALGPLVGHGTKGVGALRLHHLVEQDGDGLGHAVGRPLAPYPRDGAGDPPLPRAKSSSRLIIFKVLDMNFLYDS
jgi:hypothetical protein